MGGSSRRPQTATLDAVRTFIEDYDIGLILFGGLLLLWLVVVLAQR